MKISNLIVYCACFSIASQPLINKYVFSFSLIFVPSFFVIRREFSHQICIEFGILIGKGDLCDSNSFTWLPFFGVNSFHLTIGRILMIIRVRFPFLVLSKRGGRVQSVTYVLTIFLMLEFFAILISVMFCLFKLYYCAIVSFKSFIHRSCCWRLRRCG